MYASDIKFLSKYALDPATEDVWEDFEEPDSDYSDDDPDAFEDEIYLYEEEPPADHDVPFRRSY